MTWGRQKRVRGMSEEKREGRGEGRVREGRV